MNPTPVAPALHAGRPEPVFVAGSGHLQLAFKRGHGATADAGVRWTTRTSGMSPSASSGTGAAAEEDGWTPRPRLAGASMTPMQASAGPVPRTLSPHVWALHVGATRRLASAVPQRPLLGCHRRSGPTTPRRPFRGHLTLARARRGSPRWRARCPRSSSNRLELEGERGDAGGQPNPSRGSALRGAGEVAPSGLTRLRVSRGGSEPGAAGLAGT